MQGNQDKFNNNVEITINQIIQIIKLKNSITPGSTITPNKYNLTPGSTITPNKYNLTPGSTITPN
jgi:hypothetical protein